MIEIKHRHTGAVIHTHDGASLAGAYLAGAYLANANLAGANLSGANLAGANLANANLTGADLAGANLAGANLTWANLANANLAGAYLAGANLAGAYLANANLAGAYLAGAKITPDHALVGTRPLLQIGPLGSRGAMLLAFCTDKGLMLRTGCFFGTPEEFEAAVRHTHGDSTHAADYLSALVFVRDWFARAE
jgi:uncharacterized protein YjbI with pentapeptide repeats